MRMTPLHPSFGVEIHDVDLSRVTATDGYAAIRAAFEEHSVLLFRDQPLDDDSQVAFSLRFGNLEITRSMNPAAGTPFVALVPVIQPPGLEHQPPQEPLTSPRRSRYGDHARGVGASAHRGATGLGF